MKRLFDMHRYYIQKNQVKYIINHLNNIENHQIYLLISLAMDATMQYNDDDPLSDPKPNPNVIKKYNSIMDSNWVLRSSYLVLLMQAGFSLLESGMVRAKNTKNILVKNLITTALGAIIFFGIGYSLSFDSGKSYSNPLIACCSFFSLEEGDYYVWVSKWAFSSIACTIINGSVSERTKIVAYLILNTVVPGIIYPLAAHWIWNEGGWLYQLGVVDYGGGIAVHVLGGTIGLVGTMLLGPRLGKFDPETGKPLVLSEHNIVLSSIGTLFLWFSWYGQHPVLYGMDLNKSRIASRGAINTTLSGSISMVTSFVITVVSTKRYDLKICINGLLAGFVASSASAGFIEPYYSIIVGVVSSFIFIGFSKLLLRYQIDDPCQSTSVHFACGIWGAVSCGLFSDSSLLDEVYKNRENHQSIIEGVFIQLIGVSATIIWCTILAYVVFKILKKYSLLRVDSDIELTGFDNAHHGGAAYNYRSYKNNSNSNSNSHS
ncbi:hypothetical protein PPL_01606 [Heterostelium album PN500]|uniref:Ammonium transporter n=1 Tax=Heterostelium pallidum (strain ATCC 26659 / Pp 5 / PN500) TaxID=670386 RepID=D3AZZ2_HETP5|nr:hypothetical protein PPL_01606 [Heterostelium album PN500]EFA84616.1 hypothetical protein PPL_01606 [Heterostelium album PN500]|eukprot:XP_020436729.1 hypothetical protein PPL_01606 [Heterostelium album PN500]